MKPNSGLENAGRAAHIQTMGNTLIGGIYVVVATKDGKTEYWAAATPRDEAAATVSSGSDPAGR